MSHLLHRNVGTQPFVAVDAKGMVIRSSDGREVIDGSGGAAVACLGHGNERVLDAIREQLARVTYAHTGFYTTTPAEELAELLVGHAPGGLSQAYFVSSGSEATEAALKLARQYMLEIGEPGRDWFIGRRQSYHGNTLGALAVGGNMVRRPPYEAIISAKVSHVAPCFAYREKRDDKSDDDYVTRLAAELEAEFRRVGPQRVAAFIAEPVVGATIGCVPALPGYFKAVREVCDRHGALLILDEVMCGMGRTGTAHAWQQEGITPDIQVIAKGLGGGYQPIGGLLIHRRIIDALRRGSGLHRHGHTYAAHPVACAAALAVQRVILEGNLIENVAARGHELGERLRTRFGDHPYVGDIRGRGLFWALEFVSDRKSKAPFNPDLAVSVKVKNAVFEAGLACYPSAGTIDGKRGDHVLLAPPYVATTADIDLIVERFDRGIQAAFQKERRAA